MKQIDSTGAGDAFLGAMLAGLRWNLPWPAIGRLANAAGAVCVTRLGAFPPDLEVRDEILELYGDSIPAPAPGGAVGPRSTSASRDSSDHLEQFFVTALSELATLKGIVDQRAIFSAAELIRDAESRGGRVHVTGVGKPEHIAHYAASLFSSIGTPATFLHATEALHGSLGQVHPHDVVIAISNSGNTRELCTAASVIKEHGAKLIAVTGNNRSELAGLADLIIHAPVTREGGGLGLAPRISVMGQVMVLAGISVALEIARGLTVEEYGRWHRAGALGAAARKIASRKKVQHGVKNPAPRPR